MENSPLIATLTDSEKDERLAVLSMLEGRQITAEQAAQLLDAIPSFSLVTALPLCWDMGVRLAAADRWLWWSLRLPSRLAICSFSTPTV